jgi:hypothetical protein
MGSYSRQFLEQEVDWPKVDPQIDKFLSTEQITRAFNLPTNLMGSDLHAVYCAAHAASFSQSDAPLSMNEAISPLVVEASVTPTAPELTPAEQRRVELEARRAAVKAEAKALAAEERALAKAARDLARAKAKAVVEAQKQELKDTTKMLLEITKMIKQKSAYGLTRLEIAFSTYDDYFEVTDIGIAYREHETMSKMETIERDFYRYCDVSADRYLFIQRAITNFDRFLELLADHVDVYIPAGTKVTDGLVVIKPHEPIKERVLVYLKEERLEPIYETQTED